LATNLLTGQEPSRERNLGRDALGPYAQPRFGDDCIVVIAELGLQPFGGCGDAARFLAHNCLGCLGCIPEPFSSDSNLMELPISWFAARSPGLLTQFLPGPLHHFWKCLGSFLGWPDVSTTTSSFIQEGWPLDRGMKFVEKEQVPLALQGLRYPLGCNSSLVLKLFSQAGHTLVPDLGRSTEIEVLSKHVYVTHKAQFASKPLQFIQSMADP
jgi:hypothetical protein